MDLSICIVTLNAKRVIENCLNSIPIAVKDLSYEITIVDNHSLDNTTSIIEKKFPEVKLIQKSRNDGYTHSMNDALKLAKGHWILQLNPDVVLSENSIKGLFAYGVNHTKVGLCEPKVITPDGKFQESTRRGLARPLAVMSYFLGLHKYFPTNKHFTEYQLNHLDENKIQIVKGISGTCMLTRRKVFEDIGYLDQAFFAYQEDSDFCIRAEKAGWEIHYNPNFIVTHHTGQGGSKSVAYLANFEWHRSYYRYYKKHFSSDYSGIFNSFYYSLMILKCVFSAIRIALKQ